MKDADLQRAIQAALEPVFDRAICDMMDAMESLPDLDELLPRP